MPRRQRPRRGLQGAASLELVGLLPLLIAAALVAWQLLLVGATATAAENAARTGGRVLALTGSQPSAADAAQQALPGWLRGPATVRTADGQVTVRVPVPVVVPGTAADGFAVSRSASFPR